MAEVRQPCTPLDSHESPDCSNHEAETDNMVRWIHTDNKDTLEYIRIHISVGFCLIYLNVVYNNLHISNTGCLVTRVKSNLFMRQTYISFKSLQRVAFFQ